MDFIRNKEVKRQIVVSSILILFWGGIGIIVDLLILIGLLKPWGM